MATYIYEFEVFKGEKYWLALPFDMPGATQGENMEDLGASASDWLRSEIEHRAMHGIEIPEPTFGNEPQHGGRVMLVCVEAGKEAVRRMLPSQAARELGVSPARVTQMMKANLLEHFEYEGRTWVTADSVAARKADPRPAGRPKKAAAV